MASWLWEWAPGAGNGPRHGPTPWLELHWRCGAFPAGPEAVECARGTRLYLLVTATTGTSREAVTGGQEVGQPPWLSLEGTTGNVPLQLHDSPRPGVGSPPGGPGKRGRWELGISVRWHVPDRVGMSPRARPRCHKAGEGQGEHPGKASSQGFIQHSMNVQRLLGEEENHREGGNASPEPHVPALVQGTGTEVSPPPQRGGSNRYSRSGCRSLCSLFLFLANSLSMAITSVSNSAGVGFASVAQ